MDSTGSAGKAGKNYGERMAEKPKDRTCKEATRLKGGSRQQSTSGLRQVLDYSRCPRKLFSKEA